MPTYSGITSGTCVSTSSWRGKVVQVVNSSTFRVATKCEYGICIDDVIYVYRLTPATRVLDGDWIRVFGRVTGLQTYTAVLGNRIEIPKIQALHIDIVSGR